MSEQLKHIVYEQDNAGFVAQAEYVADTEAQKLRKRQLDLSSETAGFEATLHQYLRDRRQDSGVFFVAWSEAKPSAGKYGSRNRGKLFIVRATVPDPRPPFEISEIKDVA